MNTGTDIEIIFSHPEDLLKAKRMAKTVVKVYYQNNFEFLPFADMKKENADGWMHYPGRYVRYEKVRDFEALWMDYRMEDRPRRGATEKPNQEKAKVMLRNLSSQGNRLVFCDCGAIQEERLIEHNYFEDFFSLFCFLLAVTNPDHSFEGMRRMVEPQSYVKRVLTHAVYDGTTLTFEQMEGDPVYATDLVSWTRRDDRFWKNSHQFPFIRVELITEDRHGIMQDAELNEWVRSVNDVEMEMVSAELCLLNAAFNKYPHVMIRAASRAVCVRYRDELSTFMAKKGIQTSYFSILRANECSGAEIIIPDSVTQIGEKAFMDCGSLRRVVIPDGVTEIAEYAFRYCDSLEEIIIPESVTNIDPYAFSGCPETLVIRGRTGSAAQRFAEKKGFRFEEME